MKKITELFLALILIISLSACGESKAVEINTEELARALENEYLGGKNELISFGEETGRVRYGIDGLYSYLYCCGSITIASDEVVLVEGKSEDDAKKIYELIEKYRNDRIELFKSYAADEVPKLEDAFLERSGKYVIFVASEDVSVAKKLFKEAKG